MKIVVTGANGQVGQELATIKDKYQSWDIYFYDRSSLDITDPSAIDDCFKAGDVDICINCAAYTAVDKAESEEDNCGLVNHSGPELLAKACNKYNVKLIHLSTDYVYHNDSTKPLLETDATMPKGVYAKTKLSGEQAVSANAESYIIIRTSWVYSSFGNNFVKTMLRLGKDRDKLSIVSDQIGTPTYARDIARTIYQICQQGWTKTQNGTYNFSNAGETNWSAFAREIFNVKNISCHVSDISTKEYGAAAERPLWSVLSKEKIKATFNVKPRHWKESLKECLELL